MEERARILKIPGSLPESSGQLPEASRPLPEGALTLPGTVLTLPEADGRLPEAGIPFKGGARPFSGDVRPYVGDLKSIEASLVMHATPVYIVLLESGFSFDVTSTLDKLHAAEVLNVCIRNGNFRGNMESLDHFMELLSQHVASERGESDGQARGDAERQSAHSFLRLIKLVRGEELSPEDLDQPYMDAILEYGRRGMFAKAMDSARR
jgi:hypothetical protein